MTPAADSALLHKADPLSLQHTGSATPQETLSERKRRFEKLVLPHFDAPVHVFPKRGEREDLSATLDTIVFEPDHERLTPRENEVLTYLSKGFTIKEIANLMGIKWFTVNDHIKSIYKKLNVSSRAEAAVLATKQGLV